VVAVSMGDLSLEEERVAGAASSKEEEDRLEEEKHEFFFDGAPDGLRCSVGFCLMTEAVVAMDGFSYQMSSLDEHIAHCAAKGQPLTSPLTREPMDGMYLPNQSFRTFVKEYIDQREKEWTLHLAQRRRRGKKANESGGEGQKDVNDVKVKTKEQRKYKSHQKQGRTHTLCLLHTLPDYGHLRAASAFYCRMRASFSCGALFCTILAFTQA